MDDENADPHALEAFEGFIEACSELVTLHVNLSKTESFPRVHSIIRHKKTLQSLSIHTQHSRNPVVKVYSEHDFEALCTQCTELRQLSLMFPKLPADGPLLAPAEFANCLVGFLRPTCDAHMLTMKFRDLPGNSVTLSLSTFVAGPHAMALASLTLPAGSIISTRSTSTICNASPNIFSSSATKMRARMGTVWGTVRGSRSYAGEEMERRG